MSNIDEALSANATIADDYDPARGKPPAPRIASPTSRRTPRSRFRRPGHIHGSRRTFQSGGSFFDVSTGRLSEVFPDGETVAGQ